jgi:hypothetical protein
VWQLGEVAGSADIALAYLPGLSDTVYFAARPVTDAVDSIAFVAIRGSATNRATVIGGNPTTVQGRLLDQFGNPVSNATVSFSSIFGGETISAAPIISDLSGLFSKTIIFSTADSSVVRAKSFDDSLDFVAYKLKFGDTSWNPPAVFPGQNAALTFPLVNHGPYEVTLAAASGLSFTDGIATWSAQLDGDYILAGNSTSDVTTQNALVDNDFVVGSYFPTLAITGPDDLAGHSPKPVTRWVWLLLILPAVIRSHQRAALSPETAQLKSP